MSRSYHMSYDEPYSACRCRRDKETGAMITCKACEAEVIEVDHDSQLCGDCWKFTDSYRKDKDSETGYVCAHFYECEAHMDVK